MSQSEHKRFAALDQLEALALADERVLVRIGVAERPGAIFQTNGFLRLRFSHDDPRIRRYVNTMFFLEDENGGWLAGLYVCVDAEITTVSNALGNGVEVRWDGTVVQVLLVRPDVDEHGQPVDEEAYLDAMSMWPSSRPEVLGA